MPDARKTNVLEKVRTTPPVQALRRTAIGDALARSTLWQRVSGNPPSTGNPLQDYFERNQGRLIHKWMHYFDIYHRHFAPFRGKPVTIVEFGVSHGGSLQMWKHYFGPRARIVGVDIDPRCASLGENQIEIVIGDQDDRGFLRELGDRIGHVDVLIEDGGHTMTQQIATFEEMWPHIVDGGVYLTEDLHTNYWQKWGGGYRREGTFIEYAKNLIDQQHAWHARDEPTFVVDDYTRTIRGMHVYDSVIVLDKAVVEKPVNRRTGKRRNEMERLRR